MALEASGSKLTLSGGASTNAVGGQLIIDSASTLQYTQGLATNAGTLSSNDGTFDNNALTLTNTGIINGSGSCRTGGLTSSGTINVTAGTSFFGSVANNGAVHIYGSVRKLPTPQQPSHLKSPAPRRCRNRRGWLCSQSVH